MKWSFAADLALHRMMVSASLGFEWFKCERCGDVIETKDGIVLAEIAHAIHGCNGSLRVHSLLEAACVP